MQNNIISPTTDNNYFIQNIVSKLKIDIHKNKDRTNIKSPIKRSLLTKQLLECKYRVIVRKTIIRFYLRVKVEHLLSLYLILNYIYLDYYIVVSE